MNDSPEREIIRKCIEALAEQAGTMNGRAEQSAKHDRYAEACEYQTLARGLGMAINRLEEMRRVAS